uniref:Uncharacterized protein n=1 Tax=Rhizophora mucronata TaxID=61149 RepID=A0A2P2MPC0_RHIMU
MESHGTYMQKQLSFLQVPSMGFFFLLVPTLFFS